MYSYCSLEALLHSPDWCHIWVLILNYEYSLHGLNCGYHAPVPLKYFLNALFPVNNFQTITEELVRKQESLDESEELARMKEELSMELHKHDHRMNTARYVYCQCTINLFPGPISCSTHVHYIESKNEADWYMHVCNTIVNRI